MVLSLALGSEAALADDCNVPGSLVALARMAESVSDRPAITEDEADRLRLASMEVDVRAVANELLKQGYRDRTPEIAHLVYSARAVAEGQIEPARLADAGPRALDLAAKLCGRLPEPSDGRGARGKNRPAGLETPEVALFAEGEGGAAAMGGLIGALGGLIATMLLARLFYRWAQPLIRPRRSCLIPCELRVGGETVAGRITILGPVDFHFTPQRQSALRRLAEAEDGAACRLMIDGARRAARIEGVRGAKAEIRFEEKLERALLDKWLGLSSVTPRQAPKRPSAPEIALRPQTVGAR